MSNYEPAKIEAKWQAFWENDKTFKVDVDLEKPKRYVLDMFPYPSGNGLHVGHVENYTGTDIYGRYFMARGHNVLHPMGWDAFGLPAEQHALKTGTHPKIKTAENIAVFKGQMQRLGFGYDWDREVATSDADYYKWTQWIFLQLYKRDLAYIAEVPVNWCPELGTVLSNEEVQDGVSEVGGFPVIRKPMRQWMLKITEYAERLIDDLDLLDWPDSLKDMQRNWIGKSVGAEVDFAIDPETANGVEGSIRVYTTRPDTLFGATYMVLAPEHHLVAEITSADKRTDVENYVEAAARKSDLLRTELSKEKTGVFTGAYAINPTNDAKIPIWIADYVLATYGTGAIMAVPGHDDRDWEFAKTFDLPIVEVVSGGDVTQEAFTNNQDGVLVNSGLIDGLKVPEAKAKITGWLEEKGVGEKAVNYKLRDWLFSRQRYWGEPFPILHLEDGSHKAIPEEELPLVLPDVENYRPSPDGEPPLANATEWVSTTDPETGQPAQRETNTMPQWAGSCWYYLRFLDPNNETMAVDPEKEKYWMPVDLYVGGTEHAVLHLLYARFWHKVLYDIGVVSTKEPFQRIVNQGMILGIAYEYYEQKETGEFFSFENKPRDGVLRRTVHADDVRFVGGDPMHPDAEIKLLPLTEKMSKSRGNVVNPDDVAAQYGADTLRMYVMFMGPFEAAKPWDASSVSGVYRFVKRIWRLFVGDEDHESKLTDAEPSEEILKATHRCIQRVTDDTEHLRFNTGIAAMMEYVNFLYKLDDGVPKYCAEMLSQIIAPYAPHLAEELWEFLGHQPSVIAAGWPAYDEKYLVDDTIELAVQVMGKTRGKIYVAPDAPEEVAVEAAKAEPSVFAHLDGKEIRRIIYKEGRILNFVVG